jgi:hypothetical protein
VLDVEFVLTIALNPMPEDVKGGVGFWITSNLHTFNPLLARHTDKLHAMALLPIPRLPHIYMTYDSHNQPGCHDTLRVYISVALTLLSAKATGMTLIISL